MQTINVVTLNKPNRRFVFRFVDEHRDDLLQQVAQFAKDSEIDFTWFDAAIVSNKIRKGHFECFSSTSTSKPSQRLT